MAWDKDTLSQGGVDALAWIRARDPSSWLSYPSLDFPSTIAANFRLTLLTLLFLVLLPWAFARYQKMQDDQKRPFPFLELPQELRDMVYDHFMEDPVYPPPRPCPTHNKSLWSIPGRRSSTSSTGAIHKANWLMLANKQIYHEYMDMLCKRTTFRFTVSTHNYNASPADSSPPPPESIPSLPCNENKIWNIAPATLQNLRTGTLKLVTTSAMLGVPDPRNMISTDWVLARQVREELKHLCKATNLTLDAKAIGDPLWNPLWIWYHASQSFKSMGTEQSDTVPKGPKLNRITFSLDSWSPGENYLERDAKNRGAWTWYCMKGHNVGLDIGPMMTVREFCGKLYQECRECRPELDSEDEDE